MKKRNGIIFCWNESNNNVEKIANGPADTEKLKTIRTGQKKNQLKKRFKNPPVNEPSKLNKPPKTPSNYQMIR